MRSPPGFLVLFPQDHSGYRLQTTRRQVRLAPKRKYPREVIARPKLRPTPARPRKSIVVFVDSYAKNFLCCATQKPRGQYEKEHVPDRKLVSWRPHILSAARVREN